ncbi:MAG: ATP-binding protein [Syntrophomonas sp.]
MPSYSYTETAGSFDFQTVNSEIEAFCEQNDIPPNKLFALQLILEELVTNIINHGSSPQKSEVIDISLAVQDDLIRLAIRDNARAFNPLEAAEPDTGQSLEDRDIGGLGLFLVRKKVKSLSYEYIDGFNNVTAEI